MDAAPELEEEGAFSAHEGPAASAALSTQPEYQLKIWIAEQTRLPVLVESPDQQRRYTFATSPVPLPQLPAELLAEVAKREAAIRWRQERFNIPQ